MKHRCLLQPLLKPVLLNFRWTHASNVRPNSNFRQLLPLQCRSKNFRVLGQVRSKCWSADPGWNVQLWRVGLPAARSTNGSGSFHKNRSLPRVDYQNYKSWRLFHKYRIKNIIFYRVLILNTIFTNREDLNAEYPWMLTIQCSVHLHVSHIQMVMYSGHIGYCRVKYEWLL